MTKPDLGGAAEALLRNSVAYAALVDDDDDPLEWDEDWNRKFHQWASLDSDGCVALLFPGQPSTAAGRIENAELIFQFAMEDQKPSRGAYLVGKTTGSNAWRLPETNKPYQDMCKEIVSCGFGETTCVVIWDKGKKIAVLPNGVMDGKSKGYFLAERTDASAFEDEVLCEHLKHIELEVLAAEDLRPDFWECADKFWPDKRAERVIQKHLLSSLRSHFKAFRFESETPTAGGNIDIRILPKDSTKPGRVVIELKAVKQFGSTGRSKSEKGELAWLAGGAVQAQTYDSGASGKYLCAYDMRKDRGEDIFVQAEKKCADHGVLLRHFEIYANAEQVRLAKAATLKTA